MSSPVKTGSHRRWRLSGLGCLCGCPSVTRCLEHCILVTATHPAPRWAGQGIEPFPSEVVLNCPSCDPRYSYCLLNRGPNSLRATPVCECLQAVHLTSLIECFSPMGKLARLSCHLDLVLSGTVPLWTYLEACKGGLC